MGQSQSSRKEDDQVFSYYSKPETVSVFPENGKYWVMKKDDMAQIMFAKKGIAARPEDGGFPSETVVSLLRKSARKWPMAPALRVERPVPPLDGTVAPPSKPLDMWMSWNYLQYSLCVRQAAKGLIALGVNVFETVCFFGANAPEYSILTLSAMHIAAIPSGIYVTDSPGPITYKICLLDAVLIAVDNQSNFEKIAELKDKIPSVKAIICWDYTINEDLTRSDGTVIKCLTYSSLLDLGRGVCDEDLEIRYADVLPERCACVVYTSGTSGSPKAVMISHDALVYSAGTATTFSQRCALDRENELFGDRGFSYIPFAHINGFLVDIIFPLMKTSQAQNFRTTYFTREYDMQAGTLPQRIRAIKPTAFLGVPWLWEMIEDKIVEFQNSTNFSSNLLKSWAVRRSEALTKKPRRESFYKKMSYQIADKLVLKRIRLLVGFDSARLLLTGHTGLGFDSHRFFSKLGLHISELYGVSEACGICTWRLGASETMNSIGIPVPGCEVKILRPLENSTSDEPEYEEAPLASRLDSEDEACLGEICCRGRNSMMGYLCNPKLGEEHVKEMEKLNAETVDKDGWIHTGDRGLKTVTGMLRFSGRLHDLLTGSDGTVIYPVLIEDRLKEICKHISNVVVSNDKKGGSLYALVTLKSVGAAGIVPGNGQLLTPLYGCETICEAASNDVYISMLHDAINQTNQTIPTCPRKSFMITKFTVLPMDFSVRHGEVTPNLKLRRNAIMERYAHIIKSMLASDKAYFPCSGT